MGSRSRVPMARPRTRCLRKSLRENQRSAPLIPPLRSPDFLRNLVALVHFMRLSLTESRTRGLVQCSVE
jgi:hypothetical protein